jgi:hypothetical protein
MVFVFMLLFLDTFYCYSHVFARAISDFYIYVTDKLNAEVFEQSVFGVPDPRLDENSVILLKLEVPGHVIDNNNRFQVSTQFAQVFDINMTKLDSVLSVQSVLDAFSRVNKVNSPVRILSISYLLKASSEDDEFIIRVHFF